MGTCQMLHLTHAFWQAAPGILSHHLGPATTASTDQDTRAGHRACRAGANLNESAHMGGCNHRLGQHSKLVRW